MLTQTQQRQIGNAERVHDTAPPVSFSCNFMYVYFSEHMDINRSGESDYQMVPKRDESSIHNNPSDLMRRCWQEEPKRTEWLLDWYLKIWWRRRREVCWKRMGTVGLCRIDIQLDICIAARIFEFVVHPNYPGARELALPNPVRAF